MFWNPEVITTTEKSLRITQITFNIIYIMRTNGKDGGNWRYRCRHWSQTVIHWPRTSFRQCWHKSSFKRLLSPKIEPYPAK